MEKMVNNLFSGCYSGRRVLVTGHTGFKGSWLTLWLKELGADVSGIALDPITNPNHWDLLRLPIEELRADINDFCAVQQFVTDVRPEIIFHLAAQPLVLESYLDPVNTFRTNVIGTANLLQAAREVDDLRAIVIATTDKCYDNKGWIWGYREIDQLGGRDPYSASKACAEFVVNSFRSSFYSGHLAPLIATARSGNVIGGGDWSDDRLIPDIVKMAQANKKLHVRSPHSTRPWLHVLDSLAGYLLLGKKLLDRDASASGAWNFSPDLGSTSTVLDVLNLAKSRLRNLDWILDQNPKPSEEIRLLLDSSKARAGLGWRPLLNLTETISLSIDWYNSYYNNSLVETINQISDYVSLARSRNEIWAI